jgi:hypothetical protein
VDTFVCVSRRVSMVHNAQWCVASSHSGGFTPGIGRVATTRRANKRCTRIPARHLSPTGGVGSANRTNDVDNVAPDGDVETGRFITRGRFNTSPESVWRALTEYDGVQHTCPSIVSNKRLWISSRVGRTVLRLQSRDRNLLWGTMKGDAVVQIEENLNRGEILFRTENVDDRADFAISGYAAAPHQHTYILVLLRCWQTRCRPTDG